jgi:hypothetical protein
VCVSLSLVVYSMSCLLVISLVWLSCQVWLQPTVEEILGSVILMLPVLLTQSLFNMWIACPFVSVCLSCVCPSIHDWYSCLSNLEHQKNLVPYSSPRLLFSQCRERSRAQAALPGGFSSSSPLKMVPGLP